MIIEITSWIAVALILVTTTVMLINQDWRISLASLALQYLAMLWLITRHLPFVMGSAKLIVGWMVVAILGMTRLGLTDTEEEDSFFPRGQAFRIALMGIIVLATAGATPRIETVIPGLGLPIIAGGLLLIGGGIVHLGITTNLLRVILGLLTLLAGFEIIYAAVESSILVSALLAVINLGLGLLGSYLLTAGSLTFENEEDV